MEIYEEMKFVKMESAIHNWKEASYRVRVCMVAFLVACVIAMWLSGTRKGDLIITIICLLANGFLTYCDVRLHQFIAKGESVLYEEQMKSIDTKPRGARRVQLLRGLQPGDVTASYPRGKDADRTGILLRDERDRTAVFHICSDTDVLGQKH